MASAAALKIRARRPDAVSRGLDDLLDAAPRESRLLLSQSDLGLFSLQHKRHEGAFSWAAIVGGQPSEAVASVNEFFDLQSHDGILNGRVTVNRKYQIGFLCVLCVFLGAL